MVRKFVIFLLVLVSLSSVASACDYMSAYDSRIPSNIPPQDIPMWRAKYSHSHELCGYYTPLGYFADIFELDAYHRWYYPELYDPRIDDFIYDQNHDINYTFLNWYWGNPDGAREWLREVWNYPEWREIIPISKMIYYEGGKTVRAFDREVAITQDVIIKAKAKYSCAAAAADPTVRPVSVVNMQLYAGILPYFYKNASLVYFKFFSGGLAVPAQQGVVDKITSIVRSLVDLIMDFIMAIKSLLVSPKPTWAHTFIAKSLMYSAPSFTYF